MKKLIPTVGTLALAALLGVTGCTDLADDDDSSNPFLDDGSGKADTGYINRDGLEVEVTIESDIVAPAYRVFDSPGELAQFAVTYLQKRYSYYVEILAEDAATPDRAEWLVDGTWLSASQARQVDKEKLTHFRIPDVNVVLLGRTADDVHAGDVQVAKVPLEPYSIFADAGDKCADYNGHISLSQSVYWYLWNPDHYGCEAELTDMTLTIEELLPRNPASYPEYDQLWADKKLTAVILFGELDDGEDIHDDYNWHGADRFADWLTDAGFTEAEDAPLGRRFVKTAGELETTIDLYYPDLFHSVVDYAHFANWQKAVSEHEVVIYLGHSVLGTGSAYEDVNYPDFYQIFLIGGCLGYEYYIRPVLAGKGSWANVDALSSIVPNGYSELNGMAGGLLSKLVWGFEHEGRASWQEILTSISQRLGHDHFGVSGARGNCYSPDGNLCEEPSGDETRYESTPATEIPDNDPTGISDAIEVSDDITVGTLDVELEVTHTYVGDLEIVLSHDGVDEVIWNRTGGSQDDIRASIDTSSFAGQSTAGTWTLKVVDHANLDSGTLDRWALVVTPE